jgi:hypothetical protein
MSLIYDYRDSWDLEESERLLDLRIKHAGLTWDEFTAVNPPRYSSIPEAWHIVVGQRLRGDLLNSFS